MTRARRYPALLFGAWLFFGIILTIGFWHCAAAVSFSDPDDYLRLQQVRDVLSGQGWFDLTQHRIAPPAGLSMHWSRLVDVPLLIFLAPLVPVIGAQHAETVAVIGAPLLTLLVLMVAVGGIVRRLFGRNEVILVIGWVFALIAPLVFAQIHPARIDHHGWQIALAAVTLAALLDYRAGWSGVVAGVASALLLAISIEGAPFVIATLGTLAGLWLFHRESGLRLRRYAQTLAIVSIVANALMAPAARWFEQACDAIGMCHLAALLLGAVVLTVAVPLAERRGFAVRLAAVLGAGALALVALSAIAPNCLSNPYGPMDPLVRDVWFASVREGLPLWHQTGLVMISIVAFPLVGMAGAIGSLRSATTEASKRRWLVVFVLGVLTLLTGIAVYRAAGIAQIVALPGALALVRIATVRVARLPSMPVRVIGQAAAIIMLSPIGLLLCAAALAPTDGTPGAERASVCDMDCAIMRLGRRPATVMLTPIDLGTVLIARTHHSAYAASYHRIQTRLRDTIAFYTGAPEAAHAFVKEKGLRALLFAPDADETDVYVRRAPHGLAAQLKAGRVPAWLRRVDFGGGNTLLLFEVVRP